VTVVHQATISCPKSNHLHVALLKDEKIGSLEAGLIGLFEECGGVFGEIAFDNLKPVVARIGRSRAEKTFTDEVQECPQILNSIKDVLDNVDGFGNYVFSGSQKWSLMEGLSDSLSGLVCIVELAGLSLREIYGVSFNTRFLPDEKYLLEREKELKEINDIWALIHRGSYPELYEHPEKDWEEFYQDYVRTYIERDVYKITKVRDYQTFYKFLISAAARTGQILDYTNIANDVGVSADTIKLWIGILQKTLDIGANGGC